MYTKKTPYLSDPDIKARLPVRVETENSKDEDDGHAGKKQCKHVK